MGYVGTGWSDLCAICDGGGPVAKAANILPTDSMEAVVVMFGCASEVLLVLMREIVVDALATEVGNGCTELLPLVSSEVMMV